MYACDYLETGFLNVLRGVTFAAPTKVYLALFLNDPGDSGTAGTEISYAGYARMEIAFSEPAVSNGGIGIQNLSDITFAAPADPAGTVTHYLTGNMSNAFKTKLLNLFRGTSILGISAHFSLWNGSPEETGSELAGDNYARVALTFSAPSEQASGQMLVQNSLAVSFNRPSTPWGVWTYSAIYSAATGGEPVYLQELTEAITIKKGYMPTIDVGALKVGLN